MNITDFTTAKGVSFEKYNAEMTKYPDRLEVKFGNYARVTEQTTLKEYDSAQALVTMRLPASFPIADRLWSWRGICFDNYQQDNYNTVRIGFTFMMNGYMALVSNRGSSKSGFHLLALSEEIPPLDVDFTISLQVRFSASHGFVSGFMNGREILYASGANIDKGVIIGRCRIGIDGASGAVGQSATFKRMVSEYNKRL